MPDLRPLRYGMRPINLPPPGSKTDCCQVSKNSPCMRCNDPNSVCYNRLQLGYRTSNCSPGLRSSTQGHLFASFEQLHALLAAVFSIFLISTLRGSASQHCHLIRLLVGTGVQLSLHGGQRRIRLLVGTTYLMISHSMKNLEIIGYSTNCECLCND